MTCHFACDKKGAGVQQNLSFVLVCLHYRARPIVMADGLIPGYSLMSFSRIFAAPQVICSRLIRRIAVSTWNGSLLGGR